MIDFDSVMSDAAHPGRLKSEYDSGDHLHPSIEGYKAMANAAHMDLFRANKGLPRVFARDY